MNREGIHSLGARSYEAGWERPGRSGSIELTAHNGARTLAAVLFFHKLLPVFVLPIGLLIILVVLGTLKQWRKLTFATLAAFYLLCTPLVGGWLIGRLEAVHPRFRVGEIGSADAVLVLSGAMGGSSPPGYLPNWSDAVERFEAGVALAQAEVAPRLLFTGGIEPHDPRVKSEGTRMRELAIERGVPAERIAQIGAVGNTADEARALARFAAEHQLKRVILVTSAWHMPRAVRQFRNSGVEIVPFPVDYRHNQSPPWPWWQLLPKASGLDNTETALRETYGILFYAVFGRAGEMRPAQ